MSLLMMNLAATLATDPGLHTKANLSVMPLMPPAVTVGVEMSFTPLNLTATAEAMWFRWNQLHPTAWTTWAQWRPLAWNGHSLGPMVGYSQSYLFMPRGIGGSPYDSPVLLMGLAYEWTTGPWTLRTVPHVGWAQGNFQALMAQQSIFYGPPLLELSWRPTSQIELGLRSSFTPLRLSVLF